MKENLEKYLHQIGYSIKGNRQKPPCRVMVVNV